jgi:lipopolysaccharide biosynthesis regulator YciM
MTTDFWTSPLLWPALLLAFLLGVQLTRWWLARAGDQEGRKVSQEYFKGLNFLLNEEPDKAIEVFIKALEVDSETVELHLALGGLFRRKGQVDRATRIHQNLIARPTLTQNQRLQAIYELAQDYYKAGLLDRAEDLFKELKESQNYRSLALEGLCRIYQQEKEWHLAIEVSKLHKRAERPNYEQRVAHYWCELAEISITEERFEEAQKYLRNALSENRKLARAVLLRGELHFKQGQYRQALDLWQSLSVTEPMLAALVIEKIIDSFKALDDRQGLDDYLINATVIPRQKHAFEKWYQNLSKSLGESDALTQLFEKIKKDGISGPAAGFLHTLIEENSAESAELEAHFRGLLKDLLNRAKNRRIEYTCKHCGFDMKSLYWLCPNCSEWDSFSV